MKTRASQHLRTILACSLLAVGSSADASNESGLEGVWIGGFRGTQDTVALEVTFSGTGRDVTAALDLPQRGEHGIPIEKISQRGDRLSFELPGVHDNLLFEGRLRGNDRIEGSIRQGVRGYARFEMIRLARLSADRMQGLLGTYTWGDDHVLLVAASGDAAVYVDYESGRTGSLYALAENRLVGGPTMGTGYPVSIDVTFARNPSGVAQSVEIVRGNRKVTAVRETFYREQDVSFTSGDVTIAGTLLSPVAPGRHPGLVMVHGSGPVKRDTLRPFADHFARNGVAVLITDKRGSGASSGNWARATFDDLAADALAGVHYLRGRPDILPRAIGLHGISMGGWVAPLAATRSRDVAFVVVESAPTLTPREHERLRVESQLRADSFEREDIARALSFMDLKFEVARTGEHWDRLSAAIASNADASWLSYTNPPDTLESLRWHWDHIFGYDPIPALARLEVPMLVLYGELDSIVPPRVHRTRMEEALAAADRHNVTIHVFENANHGFFQAMTGGRQEYPSLAGFVDGYFETRTRWVLDQVSAADAAPVAESQD